MQIVELNVQSRSEAGKGVARKLRAEGLIPGILYGAKEGPVPLSLVRRELAMLLQNQGSQHLLLNLHVHGDRTETTLALLHQLELDPVRNNPIHADFLRVDRNKPIHTTVPITLEGTPVGVRNGGIEQFVLREVEVEALPSDIPEEIKLNTSHLDIGDSIHVSELTDEGKAYTILTDPERVIATVLAPKLTTADEEEIAAEAEAEAAEGETDAEETAEGDS